MIDIQLLIERMLYFHVFFILKNILILLYPFVPETMQKLRYSLNLEKAHIYDKSNLATGF